MDSDDIGCLIYMLILPVGFFLFCVFISWWNSDAVCEIDFNDGSRTVVKEYCYVSYRNNVVKCTSSTYSSFKSLRCYHGN